MRKGLEERLQRDAQGKGYRCDTCSRNYSPLDAAALVNPETFLFECEICQNPLISISSESSNLSQTSLAGEKVDLMLQSRMVEQTNAILRLLKKMDQVQLPTFDPEAFLASRSKYELGMSLYDVGSQSESLANSASSDLQSSHFGNNEIEQVNNGLRSIVGDSPTQSERSEVEIVFQPEPTIALKNVLPSWHTHSSITGNAIHHASLAEKKPLNSTDSFSKRLRSDADNHRDYLRSYESSGSTLTTTTTTASFTDSDKNTDLVDLAPETNEVVLVVVAGVPKRIEDITDEDKERMNEDEYRLYYTAMADQYDQ